MARQFPVVLKQEDTRSAFIPTAIIGRAHQNNHLVNHKGEWVHDVLPGLLSLYPFSIEIVEDDSMRVLIDAQSESFSEQVGFRLFDPEGNPSEHLKKLLALFNKIYEGLALSQKFGAICYKLDLLRKVSDENYNPNHPAFYIVELDALLNLAPSDVVMLKNKKWLPILYAMAISVQQDFESNYPLLWTAASEP